jgi:hypothetical protein
MATAQNHVDRLIPWMLDVIEAYALVDEVGWSLNQQMLAIGEGQFAPHWSLLLTVKNPLLGQGDLVGSMITPELLPFEFDFKSKVLEMLNALHQSRQAILSGTGMTGPGGTPLS